MTPFSVSAYNNGGSVWILGRNLAFADLPSDQFSSKSSKYPELPIAGFTVSDMVIGSSFKFQFIR